MFDYEWATVQHTVNCSLAQAVVVPDAIPPRACAGTGPATRSILTPGSRRSITWPTSSPIPPCSAPSDSIPASRWSLVRTPPEVSLYHRFENDLFGAVLRRLQGHPGGGPPPDARAASPVAGGRRPDRPRAGGRRSIAHRLRRSRGLSRRHDEPRGRRPWGLPCTRCSRGVWAPWMSGSSPRDACVGCRIPPPCPSSVAPPPTAVAPASDATRLASSSCSARPRARANSPLAPRPAGARGARYASALARRPSATLAQTPVLLSA